MPVKYNFDACFSDEGAPDPHEEELNRLRKQIEDARKQGELEGVKRGKEEAKKEQEARISQTLDKILSGVSGLARQQKEQDAKLEAEAAKLAFSIASKLAPTLMERHPLAEIEQLVHDCLDGCRREPRVVIRVHESILDPIEERLEALKLAAGFAGNIVLVSDTGLGAFDCRVEWPDGGAERDLSNIEKQINLCIRTFIYGDEALGEAEDASHTENQTEAVQSAGQSQSVA